MPTATQRAAPSRRQAGLIRQFFILSARNLKIILQDSVGRVLMLALAPIIGLMEFIWGSSLFDLQEGDATKAIMMLFMAALISLMVGAMASVREIVKEADIYKRERAINLNLASYILSKIWIGVALSFYQAAVLLFFLYVLVLRTSPLALWQYGLILVTMFLGTLCGYLTGLCISALAPNQNVALLLVIVVLVPQFLFSGALLPLNSIPGSQIISLPISTRWAFEAMVNISGIGNDVADDACWQYVMSAGVQPSELSEEQKTASDCKCMGVRMFDECRFPGIRNPEFYTDEARDAMAAPRPIEPPKPSPYPTFTPAPTFTPIPTPARQSELPKYQQDREQQVVDYQKRLENQGKEYQKKSVEQGDEYASALKGYGDELKRWEANRQKAIGAAESNIKFVVDNFGHTFTGGVLVRWLALGVIMLVVFVMTIIFQKRKDVI